MTSAISSPTDGKILAVDTSTASGSLAIANLKDSHLTVINEVHWQKKAMHSEVATLELIKLLGQTGQELKDITHYTVNVGPGSFTGLRVGINLVRTLAYAVNRPVAPLSSLEILAFANSQEGEKVLIATKAVQNFWYVGVYQKVQGRMVALSQPHSSLLDEALALMPGIRTCIEGQSPSMNISAKNLLEMTATASFFSWNDIKPLYVRASEAEEKLKKGILKPL